MPSFLNPFKRPRLSPDMESVVREFELLGKNGELFVSEATGRVAINTESPVVIEKIKSAAQVFFAKFEQARSRRA